MSLNRIGAGGPFLVGSKTGDSLPQGAVVPAEYQWGTHALAIHGAEGIKSVVFRSVVAAIVTAAVSQFIAAPQQAYADVNPSFVQKSVVAGATPRPIPLVRGAPQFVDLTLPATFFQPLAAPQGPVPAPTTGAPQLYDFTPQGIFVQSSRTPPVVSQALRSLYGAPQLADLTLAAQLAKPLTTPQGQVGADEYHFGAHAQAIHSAEAVKSSLQKSAQSAAIIANPVATFFSNQPQSENRETSRVWPSQAAGATPSPIPLIRGAPQVDPTQVDARLWAAQPAAAVIPNPIAKFFSVPPQTEERETRSIWRPQIAGSTPKAATVTVQGPQTDPAQIAAKIFASVSTPPAAIQGPAPAFVLGGQPQVYDFTQQGWIVQAASGQAPPPPVIDVGTSTPGRITHIPSQFKVEDQIEKQARRLRDAALPQPQPVKPEIHAYFERSAMLAAAISRSRSESAELRAKIAAFEARERERLTAKTRARLEHKLLLAQQQLTFTSVQEAVLLEEMEILDIAFIAMVGVVMMQ